MASTTPTHAPLPPIPRATAQTRRPERATLHTNGTRASVAPGGASSRGNPRCVASATTAAPSGSRSSGASGSRTHVIRHRIDRQATSVPSESGSRLASPLGQTARSTTPAALARTAPQGAERRPATTKGISPPRPARATAAAPPPAPAPGAPPQTPAPGVGRRSRAAAHPRPPEQHAQPPGRRRSRAHTQNSRRRKPRVNTLPRPAYQRAEP